MDKQCIFFNKGKCKKGNERGYNHDEKERKKWLDKRKANAGGMSQRSPPAAPAAADGDKIAQLVARNKELQSRLSKPKFCQAYITTGCFDPACSIMHVEKEEVDKHRKAQKALAAQRAKAKKEARAQSVG